MFEGGCMTTEFGWGKQLVEQAKTLKFLCLNVFEYVLIIKHGNMKIRVSDMLPTLPPKDEAQKKGRNTQKRIEKWTILL